jgi:D-glycero-alpha-D-manno-heptose-7-phosphate kinase
MHGRQQALIPFPVFAPWGPQGGATNHSHEVAEHWSFIEILEYPHAIVSPVHPPQAVRWELERRLLLVFLGQSHSSSKVHERVIVELENAGPDAEKLRPLRRTPLQARDAIYTGDFAALGRAMIENTESQASLHPDLVSTRHQEVIEIGNRFLARRHSGYTGVGLKL